MTDFARACRSKSLKLFIAEILLNFARVGWGKNPIGMFLMRWKIRVKIKNDVDLSLEGQLANAAYERYSLPRRSNYLCLSIYKPSHIKLLR